MAWRGIPKQVKLLKKNQQTDPDPDYSDQVNLEPVEGWMSSRIIGPSK